MKRKRATRKPKAQRTSLNKRLAAASTLSNKDGLALPNKLSVLFDGYDFHQPHTKAEELVYYHKYLRCVETVLAQPRVISDGAYFAKVSEEYFRARKLLEKTANAFIWEVLNGYHPEKLAELVREMKRDWSSQAAPKDQKPLVERMILLDASAGGAVPDFDKLGGILTDAKYAVAEKYGKLRAEELQELKAKKAKSKARRLRDIASHIGVKARPVGRPKKSDT